MAQKTTSAFLAKRSRSLTAEIKDFSNRPTVDESDLLGLAARIVAQMPDPFQSLMEPNRYKARWGGRGSSKSTSLADALLATGLLRTCRVVCAREFMISIRDSVHSLLKQRIYELGLSSYYEIQRDRIHGTNGTEFLFKGLRHNVENLKSIPGITHMWIEEAQSTSAESWEIAKPTVRDPGSEIWLSFNPKHETDVIYQQFVVDPMRGADIQKVNWNDNPYFPDVLNDERLDMMRRDPEAYAHIWEGALWGKSDAQILHGKWCIEDFDPQRDWDGPYLGADFGFANDPTALIEAWIDGNNLMIHRESYAHHLEIDDTAERWMKDIPGCDRYIIYADNARPESISYLKRHGIPRITACAKGKGSIEDGIAHLRSFDRIVVHPRCKAYANECLMWSYKVDRYSGDVLPAPAPGHEHLNDGLRYSLERVMKAKSASWIKYV
ncbi:MAG: PBSX family phage terminase large subunit [Phormidesmis sp.]